MGEVCAFLASQKLKFHSKLQVLQELADYLTYSLQDNM